jgi:hypothetical protein
MKRRKQNHNITYSSWCTTGALYEALMLNELSSLKCGVSMSESDLDLLYLILAYFQYVVYNWRKTMSMSAYR